MNITFVYLFSPSDKQIKILKIRLPYLNVAELRKTVEFLQSCPLVKLRQCADRQSAIEYSSLSGVLAYLCFRGKQCSDRLRLVWEDSQHNDSPSRVARHGTRVRQTNDFLLQQWNASSMTVVGRNSLWHNVWRKESRKRRKLRQYSKTTIVRTTNS